MDTQSLFSLAGRTALVTGGSRGIGKMIATGFIAQGAKAVSYTHLPLPTILLV